jgi:hypothetical protein
MGDYIIPIVGSVEEIWIVFLGMLLRLNGR